MPFDLAQILEQRQGEKYALNEKHLNAQLVRVLKTLGYDVNFAPARVRTSTMWPGGAISTC